MNNDTSEIAQFLFDNPEYKVLFEVSMKVRPEDIEFVKTIIERMTDWQTA
jgi:hypothetical protein